MGLLVKNVEEGFDCTQCKLCSVFGPTAPLKMHSCKGLVTHYGEGGLQNGRGGHVKFYPYEKGGGRKKF